MRLEQLYYIIQTADSGSISTAAEKLHISQPSVSNAIAELERELKTQIFKRSRMGTQTTEAGRVIVDKAREIVRQVEDLKSIPLIHNQLLEGNLSIATIPTFMTILPKTIGIFKNKFPRISIDIIECGSIEAMEHVLKNDVDFALVSRREVSDFDEKFSFEPLIIIELMACASKKLVPFNKTKISIKEILNYPLVIFNETYRSNQYILNLLKRHGEPNILFKANNLESLKHVVAEGLAIGFYTNLTLKTDLHVQNGDIIPMHIIEQKSNSTLGILRKKKKNLSTVSEEFFNELRTQTMNYKRLFNL